MKVFPGRGVQFHKQLVYVLPTAMDALQRRARCVLEISEHLAQAETFEQLCRNAVALGRRELGFERLGLWFLDEERRQQLGTFGIDERGDLRDERRVRMPADTEIFTIRRGTTTLSMCRPLLSLEGRIVGFGSYLCATIWDGPDLVGYIAADNLLRHRPITTEDAEILAVYAHVLGQL